ncbi:MAG: hypothetical protein WCG47_05235 [Dermatophilaceae bacterium]
MPSVRDFLERLRPSGTPGAATISAVPADRVGERSAELEPVLARLEAVQAEASLIRQAAEVVARQRKHAAVEEARVVIATARRAVDAERRDAAAKARARAEAESRDLLADAVRDASAVAEAARTRQSGFVDRVISQARADVTDIIGGAP